MRPAQACNVLAFVLTASIASAGEPLFLPSPTMLDQSGRPHHIGVVRERAVGVNAKALEGQRGALAAPGQTLQLNLFDDVVLNARLVRSQRLDKGLSWVGKLEGEPVGDVVLVSYDGVLTGSIVWPGGAYRVHFDPQGTHVVEQIDGSQFSEDNDFVEVPPSPVTSKAAPDQPQVAFDDGSLIDVLVVYTPAARIAAGGTTDAMNSLINTAVTETNTGYANSGVIQRINLVGAVEVSYTESDISTDLARLQKPSDGYLDNVHALRDSTYADVVVLIGEGYGAYCGMSYLMAGNDPGFAPNAFSVVAGGCATGLYSFGHEIGHNMGLNHARVDPVGTGAFSYSYGYKDPANLFRTVMAYCCGYPYCTSGCPRVLNFSNPNVSYSSKAMGIIDTDPQSAYNAKSLNNTRVTVANWRIRPAVGGLVERYRLFSDVTKEHHYTTNGYEYSVLGTIGWVQEGIAHRVYTSPTPVSGVTPVPLYRLYHEGIRQHLWTTDANENTVLGQYGWTREGVDGYILPTAIPGTTTPLYRLNYCCLPLHLWTVDANEYAVLPSWGWIQEGIAGYVVR